MEESMRNCVDWLRAVVCLPKQLARDVRWFVNDVDICKTDRIRIFLTS